LAGTNTLAYFATAPVTKKKSCLTLTPELRSISAENKKEKYFIKFILNYGF